MIEVTAEDIEKGFRMDSRCCPIARACARAFGHEATVDTLFIVDRAAFEEDDVEYHTPQSAVTFIEEFDAGRPVEPFSFELGERDILGRE